MAGTSAKSDPKELRDSERLYQLLVESVQDYAICSLDLEGRIASWNAGAQHITGFGEEEILGEHISVFATEGDREAGKPEELLRRAMEDGRACDEGWRLRKDGSRFWADVVLTTLCDEDREPIGFAQVTRDLSGTRETEAELRQAVQRLRLHVEQTPLGAIDWDMSFRVSSWNRAAERIFGYTAEEAIGQHASFIVPEPVRPLVDEVFGNLLQHKGGERSTNQNLTKDGRLVHCEWYNTPLVDPTGEVIGVASLVQDDTERRRAEESSRRQVEHLNALRAIDLAITASLDLRVTLTVLLDQVINQLRVDAADILLLNPHTQRLEYSAGRGFRTEAIHRSELMLGECAAGRAGRDRRTVSVPSLKANSGFTRADLLNGEEFLAHYATPLVAKGQVQGILEVFHRSAMQVDPEWTGFFEALAGQAAIAVESARLFEDLQRSNLDLTLAYDTTLEGWAHALDLRDNVTEGHSRRVTEMTVRLARAIGVDDTDLVDIRRGALLHDIGKIGVPDSILHKPGPLDEEEWEIMRKHPVYSFQLLRPIEFLRPALDIPYCHHEKWDGTGYPRGLKEEEIPLPARIFTVVDIWDALRSDRPYHDAWPEERVREHIRSLAGTHLDPQVVEVFLSMEW